MPGQHLVVVDILARVRLPSGQLRCAVLQKLECAAQRGERHDVNTSLIRNTSRFRNIGGDFVDAPALF